jgi:hypothetical protein
VLPNGLVNCSSFQSGRPETGGVPFGRRFTAAASACLAASWAWCRCGASSGVRDRLADPGPLDAADHHHNPDVAARALAQGGSCQSLVAVAIVVPGLGCPLAEARAPRRQAKNALHYQAQDSSKSTRGAYSLLRRIIIYASLFADDLGHRLGPDHTAARYRYRKRSIDRCETAEWNVTFQSACLPSWH